MYNIDLRGTQMSPRLEAMRRGSLWQVPREGQGGRRALWGRRDLHGGGKAKGPSQPWLEDQVPGGEPEETEKPPPPPPAPRSRRSRLRTLGSECRVQPQLAVRPGGFHFTSLSRVPHLQNGIRKSTKLPCGRNEINPVKYLGRCTVHTRALNKWQIL